MSFSRLTSFFNSLSNTNSSVEDSSNSNFSSEDSLKTAHDAFVESLHVDITPTPTGETSAPEKPDEHNESVQEIEQDVVSNEIQSNEEETIETSMENETSNEEELPSSEASEVVDDANSEIGGEDEGGQER